ncbi:hypothetical protein FACS1894105_13590 [Clostridia bacterium]|nr:hypothetical protein FACS1894105_13590 [Clostridia bacterium]
MLFEISQFAKTYAQTYNDRKVHCGHIGLNMKLFKFAVVFICVAASVLFILTAALLIRQNFNDVMINDSFTAMRSVERYSASVSSAGFASRTSEKSAGYTCIEMLAQSLGQTEITEQSLLESNDDKDLTVSSAGMEKTLKDMFPSYTVTRRANMKNSEMIESIYNSLKNRIPVIVSLAQEVTPPEDDTESAETLESEEFILTYAVVRAMTLPENTVMVMYADGTRKSLTTEDFLEATRFDNYKNMEFVKKLSVALGTNTKNTAYFLEKKPEVENDSK